MDAKTQAARLREIETWMASSRHELDEALLLSGVDPGVFHTLAVDREALRPELRRAHDEISDLLDEPPASTTTRVPNGARI